jgi:hypothetical protein
MKYLVAISLLFTITMCKEHDSDELTLKKSEVSLSYGDKYQIEAESNYSITYLSENTFHATVSSSGMVTAGRVGETNIKVTDENDSKKLKVKVLPVYTIYETPYLEFGVTKSQVISKLGSDYQTTENSTSIFYLGSDVYVDLIMYSFDNAGKLDMVGVAVVGTISTTLLENFLNERYYYVGEYEDEDTGTNYLFINALNESNATLGVDMMYNSETGYWFIFYTALDTTSRSGVPVGISKDVMLKMKSEIKYRLQQ